MHAQLGFCQGNSGDPIFEETFGTGTNFGPALPAGTTTYNFISSPGPQDGEYTIASNTFSYGWNIPSDHTPGDVNGKALIVNASFTTGEFYNIAVSGLCENTTYEFSSWLINILPSSGCSGNGIPVNVQFEIWDITNTNLLASGNTGNIFSTPTPTWEQYALVFQTLPAQTSIILKMLNNGAGGCGNDLAIDDIVFKSCGDLIAIEDSSFNNQVAICSSQTPYSDTITAVPDNTVFSSHFYQWQISTDGTNWSDIAGETNASLDISGLTSTSYYRTKVSEIQANLTNSDCITLSDVYQITVNQAPPPPTIACWETATFSDTTCSWTVTGSQPPAPTNLECWETAVFNDTSCVWEVNGTQPSLPTLSCWETATFNSTTCSWDVTGTQPAAPTDLECWETATFNDATCTWDVSGTQPPAPSGLECWEVPTFNTATCSWDISGTQPTQPTLECWETATFDTVSCTWNISGTQPAAPTGLECWESATFNNTTCSWEITGTQPAAPTNLECWETAVFSTASCSWEITGNQPEPPTNLECWETVVFNSTLCSWDITGTQPEPPTGLLCWESAVFNEDSCAWEIIGTQPLEFREEFLSLCENETLSLNAASSIENPTSYNWVSGESTATINIDAEGTYEVEVSDGCFTEIITFNVAFIENPIIESIVSVGSSIRVDLSTTGDYLYSLNGIDYQSSNLFSNLLSDRYTIYIKSSTCDAVIISEHLHFYIPKFITPNNDGVNDVFAINVLQYFSFTEVYIFDRYGKLLFSSKSRNFFWDGTFNDQKLPSSDYWYRLIIDGKEYKGHFTLKR